MAQTRSFQVSACRAAEDHSCAQYGTFQVKERRAGDFEFWKSLPAGGANPHSPWVESDHVPYHTNERIPFANAPPPLPWWEHPKAPQMQNLLFYGGLFVFAATFYWAYAIDLGAPKFGDLDWEAIRAERNAAKDEEDEDEDEEEEEESEAAEEEEAEEEAEEAYA